jgi:putative ABC transport system substrate-binding protein
MRRRDLITLVGGAAAGWPLSARAQQTDRMRRIGVLMNSIANDPLGQARIATFQQALRQLGWSDGRNVSIEIRWSGNDVDLDRRYAAELIEHAPDVILAVGTLSVAALQRVARALYKVAALNCSERLIMLCDRARVLARSDRPETMPEIRKAAP